MKTHQGTRGIDVRAEDAELGRDSRGETEFFPAFAQAEADATRQQQVSERTRRITGHRETMKMCWPEWDGPAANGSGTSRFCEVHACCVHSLTHNDTRYHYTAPCRIESVSPDGLTVVAVVEYDRTGWTQDRYNGERLRLDITEVWPPVRLLLAARSREQQTLHHAVTSALVAA